MHQDLETHISVNLLLEAAYRLFLAEKTPLALALVHTVLEQDPEHLNARKYYQMFTGKSAPVHPANKNYRMYLDSEKGSWAVLDTISGDVIFFNTHEEAGAYMDNNPSV